MASSRRGNDKVLGVIPARLHSTRLPEKPLVDIAGKPMIQWVYERSAKTATVDRLVVATDSQLIADVVAAFGGEAILTASDHASGTDRLVEVATKLPDYGIVLNIQGDEPLIDPNTLDFLVTSFKSTEHVSMGTLAKRPSDEGEILSSASAKVVCSADGLALYFSRAPIPYNRDEVDGVDYFIHIGVYVYDRDFLLKFPTLGESKLERAERLEQLRALEFGYRIAVFETESSSFGIDTPEDLERVRRLCAN